MTAASGSDDIQLEPDTRHAPRHAPRLHATLSLNWNRR